MDEEEKVAILEEIYPMRRYPHRPRGVDLYPFHLKVDRVFNYLTKYQQKEIGADAVKYDGFGVAMCLQKLENEDELGIPITSMYDSKSTNSLCL